LEKKGIIKNEKLKIKNYNAKFKIDGELVVRLR